MNSNPSSSGKKPVFAPSPAAPQFTLEQLKALIEKRAKDIYAARVRTKAPGDALGDWLQAEKEVKAKLGIKA